MVQQPSQWPEAQREFHLAYLADPSQWPRMRVHWRVIGGMPGREYFNWVSPGWIVGWIGSRLLRRKPVNVDPFIAVFPVADPSAELIFEFTPVPSTSHGEGYVAGTCAMNGALVLELDGGELIWPTYNPRTPVTPDRRD